MKTYQTLYKKAKGIMRESLSAFSKGNVKKGNALWKKANLIFENAGKLSELENGKDRKLYGDNLNFGILYDIFEENSKKIYGSKNGNKAIAEIARLIIENKVLKKEFDTYNSLCNGDFGNDSVAINESVGMIPYIPRKVVISENRKLLSLIRKHKLNEMVDIDGERLSLYDSIESLLINKKSLKNISECREAEKTIKEHLSHREKEEGHNENISYEDVVRGFDEKFGGNVNEAEEKLMKTLTMEGADYESIFNTYKNDVISLIREKIENGMDSERDGWKRILEKAERKCFDKENSIALIADMAETKSKIENM